LAGVILVQYDSVSIGNRAMSARNNKNLTQKNVASVVGIHPATLSKFELGQHDLHGEQYIKLCNYLELSISWLLGEDSVSDLTYIERLELENYKRYLISRRK
jgi:transcriptional regulator with XRE-family HTH domain